MILDFHPSARWNTGPHRFIGYWRALPELLQYASPRDSELPVPQDFVDESWDVNERAWVVQRLKAGTPFVQWRGYSYCRFGCQDHCPMGTQCFTADGLWVWPEGFAHYVEHHGVRPPQEFVDYLKGLPAGLVAELDSRISRIEAIKAHWDPLMAGDGCPDKGTVCTFKADGYPRCKRGNVGSSQCVRASDLQYAAFKAERARHVAALIPFCTHNWRPESRS